MNIRKIVGVLLIPVGAFIFCAGSSAPAEANQPCLPCPTPPPCHHYSCGGPSGTWCVLSTNTAGTTCSDDVNQCINSGGACNGTGQCVEEPGAQVGLCHTSSSAPQGTVCDCMGSPNECYYQINGGATTLDTHGYCVLQEGTI